MLYTFTMHAATCMPGTEHYAVNILEMDEESLTIQHDVNNLTKHIILGCGSSRMKLEQERKIPTSDRSGQWKEKSEIN